MRGMVEAFKHIKQTRNIRSDVLDSLTKSQTFLKIHPNLHLSTGTLRWAKPEQAEQWTDTYIAETSDPMGVPCMQPTSGTRKNYNVSEDCLTLNVYTPGKIILYCLSYWEKIFIEITFCNISVTAPGISNRDGVYGFSVEVVILI